MRAACLSITTLQLLGASLAATIPAASLSALSNDADVSLSLPSYSTLSSSVNFSSGVSVPPPAAPYYIPAGHSLLKFYNYGASLPPAPTRELITTAMTDIIVYHRGISCIGKEVVYSRELEAGRGTLWLTVEPEADMTWGMFADAVTGARRFLRSWDNVEFAVDVEMRQEAEEKVGTVFLSRF